jgi:hypothetical protein
MTPCYTFVTEQIALLLTKGGLLSRFVERAPSRSCLYGSNHLIGGKEAAKPKVPRLSSTAASRVGG